MDKLDMIAMTETLSFQPAKCYLTLIKEFST